MGSTGVRRNVFVIGAGYPGGQPKQKVECGPEAIRSAGLRSTLEELGWNVQDHGDVQVADIIEKTKDSKESFPKAKNAQQVSESTQRLSQTLYEGITAGGPSVALTLGGDHSVAIGSISAVAKANPGLGVIWVDAHADVNTPASSPTGNIHGMPVAFLMGLADCSEIGNHFGWVEPCITPDRLVYVGLRDVDPGERRILKEKNIRAFSMHEVDKYGIAKVMEMALEHLKGRPIHLTYDVDANDPAVSPSTGTRVPGGLTWREARYLCESVFESGRLVGMDVVEVNPGLGTPEDVVITAKNAVDLVAAAFGQTLLG